MGLGLGVRKGGDERLRISGKRCRRRDEVCEWRGEGGGLREEQCCGSVSL